MRGSTPAASTRAAAPDCPKLSTQWVVTAHRTCALLTYVLTGLHHLTILPAQYLSLFGLIVRQIKLGYSLCSLYGH
jgi:hypothetical protein